MRLRKAEPEIRRQNEFKFCWIPVELPQEMPHFISLCEGQKDQNCSEIDRTATVPEHFS